jgi:folylpolyglutamate synthase/dihydropteroate synthase
VLESLWGQLGGGGGEIVPDAADALAAARSRAGAGGAVLVTGSIYLLAELVGRSEKRPQRPLQRPLQGPR